LYIDDEERAAALAFHLFDRELEGAERCQSTIKGDKYFYGVSIQ